MKTLNSVILFGKRKEMMNKIIDNKNSEIFFLKTKASVPLLAFLLNNSKIKKLLVLPSIYNLINKKVKYALEKSGVGIKCVGSSIGRPRKISKELFEKIMKEKISNKEKIKRLGISKRSFYYLKKSIKSI
ncbi:MAG: hypothetical protein PHU63_03525 [Candidatus ainarchaeum sp.]|nr:hypothetical protein [Candidatus ainarchaeum sp.]